MLVSPAERHTAILALGKVSSKPEKMGVDLAFKHKKKWYGIQRKEMKDFVASINDKRLPREIQQMKMLEQALLVIEGNVRFSLEGEWLGRVAGPRWTRAAHLSALLSLQAAGVWVLNAVDQAGTADVCRAFEAWVKKGQHRLLVSTRGAARPILPGWGKAGNEDFQRHVLEGLPDTGPERATLIREEFGGLPFMWKPGALERMAGIRGIGPKTIEKYTEAIGGADE